MLRKLDGIDEAAAESRLRALEHAGEALLGEQLPLPETKGDHEQSGHHEEPGGDQPSLVGQIDGRIQKDRRESEAGERRREQ
jgi:hypothetical protein